MTFPDDLRHSIRALQSTPGFTALVVLALGLGIGANSALFTVVNSLLLRPLPYERPRELVEISLARRVLPLEELNRAESLRGVAAFVARVFAVAEADGIKNIFGFRVSRNLFAVLGVRAALGRTFLPGEGDHSSVVVLAYEYWRRVSGDPKILGQALTIGEQKYTIIGVLPEDFTLQVRDGNLFVPYRLTEGRVVARLKPGVLSAQAAAQAEAEVAGIVRGLGPEPGRGNREERVRASRLTDSFRPNDAAPVLVLQAAMGVLLLITCANAGNLLLVRSNARRREFAIRAALGAGRAQLVRQLLTESALLAALGGAVGLAVAAASLGSVKEQLPANIGRMLRGAEALAIDWRVLVFTLAASLLALALFGLAPALSALRFDVMSCLKDSSRGSNPQRQKLSQLLVASEVALAVMLLAGADLR